MLIFNAHLNIQLKETQQYYLEDETIHGIITFKSSRVLKDPHIQIRFVGRSSSFLKGSCQQTYTIFKVKKSIDISNYNTRAYAKKMNEVEFSVQVPNGKEVPSYRHFSGSEGGKIEYTIEARLESAGLIKKTIVASHIVPILLVSKVNINEDDLERYRESSGQWPKTGEAANLYFLKASIPHEGCLRGSEVPVSISIQQPSHAKAIEGVKVALIQQEMFASSKDVAPEMTRQLPDREVISISEPVELWKDACDGGQTLTSRKEVIIKIPENVTPSIAKGAQVMRLDYKIRVTAILLEADKGKDKDLIANLPVVLGTTGTTKAPADSGHPSPLNQHMGVNPYNYDSYYTPTMYSQAPSGTTNMGFGHIVSYPPVIGGFQVPSVVQPYPPQEPPPQFHLNSQLMSHLSTSSGTKYEGGMPEPGFHASSLAANDNAVSVISDSNTLIDAHQTADGSSKMALPMYATESMMFSPNKTPTAELSNVLSHPSQRSAVLKQSSNCSDGVSLSRASSQMNTMPEKPNTPSPPQTPMIKNSAYLPHPPSPSRNSIAQVIDPIYDSPNTK